jgi:hypothetical protein
LPQSQCHSSSSGPPKRYVSLTPEVSKHYRRIVFRFDPSQPLESFGIRRFAAE